MRLIPVHLGEYTWRPTRKAKSWVWVWCTTEPWVPTLHRHDSWGNVRWRACLEDASYQSETAHGALQGLARNILRNERYITSRGFIVRFHRVPDKVQSETVMFTLDVMRWNRGALRWAEQVIELSSPLTGIHSGV